MRSSPSRRAEPAARAASLAALPFAHRGLHGDGRIENSCAAFDAAIERGHGIELDVQISRDGTAFVFHDERLDRLAEGTGPVRCFTAIALRRIRLKGSEEKLATLAEVLALVGGRVPVLIEVKWRRRRAAKVGRAVQRALRGYAGTFGVMSFNPEVGRWFAANAPDVWRGLVVTEEGRRGLRGRMARWWALRRAAPDFLAYDVRDLPSPFATAQRLRGLPVLTWTVRSPADRARAAAHADQIIYEDR